MRFLLTIFLIVAAGLTARSQNLHTRSNRAMKAYTDGKQAYDYVDYASAEKHLVDATEKDDGFIEAFLLLAELYKDQKRYDKSAMAYRRVMEIDSLFFIPAIYSYAEVLFNGGDYREAQRYFLSYLSKNQKSETLKAKAERYLLDCDFALEAIANPVPFSPVALGDSINTGYDEYWPAITVDGRYLFFTRQVSLGARNIEGMMLQEDFYYSTWSDSAWSVAKSIGEPLNTRANEGALTLAPGGQYMFFTACNRPDGQGGCDIYYSGRTSRGWLQGINIGTPLNTKYWESQPSLSPDGKKLFFVSNRPGGKGGMDLWLSNLSETGRWQEPVNLGGVINTPGDEMSPFIHFDGTTLYFSSNGRPCMGGFDIFMSKMVNDTTWSEVVNLGYPINSQTDEIGMIINSSGTTAYFSSKVTQGKGRDLFYFEMPPELRPQAVSYVRGNVYDRLSGKQLKAIYELIDLKSGSIVISSSTMDDGEFMITLTSGANYGLNVTREGYLFYSESFWLEGEHTVSRPYVKNVGLSPVRVGEMMTLYNVLFDTDSWSLRPESVVELTRLYNLLVQNSDLVVEIGGHTDSSGADEYNMLLSERRAMAVKEYLVGKGIAATRLSVKGYGATAPVSDNSTSDGMRRNRRTEIKITGKLPGQ